MIMDFESLDEDLDWDEVKHRLAQLNDAAAPSDEFSPEEADAVMEERARLLSRVPASAPDSDKLLEVMTFKLGNERFAIETRFVLEVYRANSIMPVPESPAFLRGLTNLRGEVLAVIDLRHLFDIAAKNRDETAQLIVLGRDRLEFGVPVDEVEEVVSLRIDQVLDPPDSVAGVGGEYLRGVTKDTLVIIDGEALLSDERLYMNQTD